MFATFFHELDVIPAQAGTQCMQPRGCALDEAQPRNRRA
jgi:hypothetical protein